jgi:hypothetical protein
MLFFLTLFFGPVYAQAELNRASRRRAEPRAPRTG